MQDLQKSAELVRYARALHQRGWVANHDGNLSVRLADGLFLLTPTAVSKEDITLDSLITVDEEGRVRTGNRKPFSEFSLHLACYRSRPDVMAVVHAHPPSATAFACAGEEIPEVFIPEAVVSLGLRIPTARLALPFGEEGAQPVREQVSEHDAFLLASHGAMAIGSCLEQAFLRLELVEHLARIALASRPLGGPRPLPTDLLAELMERRTKAGLGPASRSGASSSMPPSASFRPSPGWSPAPSAWSDAPHVRTEATCAPVYGVSPSSAAPSPTSATSGEDPLADLVKREIARILGG